MTKIDLKKIEEKAIELDNNMENVNRELRRLASVKCRLKKQKGRSNYEQEMTKVLTEEQVLKEVKQLLNPKEKTVTTFIQEDIDPLDYDQTIKAIKSIQSKKSLTKWLTTEEGNNDEYRQACKIEEMLLDHKSKIKPVDETTIRKTELITIIDVIENQDLTQERILELLRVLI